MWAWDFFCDFFIAQNKYGQSYRIAEKFSVREWPPIKLVGAQGTFSAVNQQHIAYKSCCSITIILGLPIIVPINESKCTPFKIKRDLTGLCEYF